MYIYRSHVIPHQYFFNPDISLFYAIRQIPLSSIYWKLLKINFSLFVWDKVKQKLFRR